MVAVELDGRLGNQLFQYAFIYAASKELDTSFYIDTRKVNFMLPQYFDIHPGSIYPLDILIRKIDPYGSPVKTKLKLFFYKILEVFLLKNAISFSNAIAPSEQISLITDNTFYHGYFQSEEYFKNYLPDLTKLFSIKKRYTTEFDNIFNTLPKGCKYVCVHIRRSDYIQLNLNLPLDYYLQAMQMIDHEKVFYIFISDDTKFVREAFAHIPNKLISSFSEIIDFQFLMNADYCIISNSSFSYWGAYLNKKALKVIAPKYWSGFKAAAEYPKRITTDKFIWLEV